MACCMSAVGSFYVIADASTAAQTAMLFTQLNDVTGINAKLRTIENTMCNWAQPEVGDVGESAWTNLWKAALVAVAIINTVAQVEIMQKRYQIAKDYANLAKEKWRRFRDMYAPHEQSILNEIRNTLEPEPDYVGARGRATEFVREAWRSAREELASLAKKYALCIDWSLLNDMDLAEAIAYDDKANFDYRYEEYFTLILSDIRWNRRSQMLNLGRDIHATSAKYADAANGMLAGLGEIANEGASGAMTLLGYLSERRNTQYPAQFSMASPLSGPSSLFGDSVFTGVGSW